MKTRRAEARWIEKESRWRIKVQKDGICKTFYSKKPTITGKREAERAADAWLGKGESGDVRFGELWEQFLKRCKDTTGTSNYIKHEQMGRLWLLPKLHFRRMSEITPLMWQECIDNGYKAGLKKKSLQNIRASIMAAFKHAKLLRLPVDKPELTIPSGATSLEHKIMQPDALKELFSKSTILVKVNQFKAIEQEAFYIHAWRFLVVSGLRCGELCGIRHEDIKGAMIDLKRSFNVLHEETRGKNNNARRAFILNVYLRSILEDQAEMLKKAGIVSPWVFPAEGGGETHSRKLYRDWESCRNQFKTSCSLHEMRHTMISVVEPFLPDSLLKPLVGHSEKMDTHGVYGHEVEGDKHLTASLIDKAFDRFLSSFLEDKKRTPNQTEPETEPEIEN